MKLGNLAPETVLTAMQCLAQDPNFEVLKQVIQMNDIDKMRLDLEDDKISVEDTQKLRYRLKVFKEMMEMPQKLALLLIDSIK